MTSKPTSQPRPNANEQSATQLPPSGEEKGENSAKRPAVKLFKFGFLVHDVSRVRRTVIDQVMRPYGITRSQWSVLSALSRGGNNGMMQVDLARLLEMGKVTVGGLVDRLEASGHVVRQADKLDRRAKRVFITEQGFEVIRLMIAVSGKMNRRMLKGLTPLEIETVERALLHVKANLKEMGQEFLDSGESEEFGSRIPVLD
jgi:DNA-binding MarR family transcriptional regulator